MIIETRSTTCYSSRISPSSTTFVTLPNRRFLSKQTNEILSRYRLNNIKMAVEFYEVAHVQASSYHVITGFTPTRLYSERRVPDSSGDHSFFPTYCSVSLFHHASLSRIPTGLHGLSRSSPYRLKSNRPRRSSAQRPRSL
jgi:hypothetical protein